MSAGSSYVSSEDEEEEFETASSEVQSVVRPSVPVSSSVGRAADKQASSELSSLSSSEEDPVKLSVRPVQNKQNKDEESSSGSGSPLPQQKQRAASLDDSSVSLSVSERSAERTATIDAPPPSLQQQKQLQQRSVSGEEEEEEEMESEEESEVSEEISSVESSEKLTSIKSPKGPVAPRSTPAASAPAASVSAVPASAAVAKSVAAAPTSINKCGPIKCPLEGPIEVDIEDLARICRCGQSAKFPFCDNSHVAYNAANGTNFGYFQVDPLVMGSTLFVCGCGKSARREAGVPLCDYACRPQEDMLVPVVAAGKPPSIVDVAVPAQPAAVEREAVARPPPTITVIPPPATAAAAEVRAQSAPRSASVVIKVVDKLRDSSLGDVTTDGEEEDGESSFETEEDSVAEIKTQPPIPVSVAVAHPSEPAVVEAVVSPREQPKQPPPQLMVEVDTSSEGDEDDSALAREEERTVQLELEAQQRARQAEEDRKRDAELKKQREAEKREAEERKAREEQAARAAEVPRQQPADERIRAMDVVVAVPPVSKKEEKAALFAEEMRLQEQQMAARREKMLAEEAKLRQQQMRDRDEAATEARRKAALAAQARRKEQPNAVVARAGPPEAYAIETVPKAKADREAPLTYSTKPDVVVDADLFDSSDESIYLMWEEGAASRSRALNMAVAPGYEQLYVSEWDPASAAARLLIAKKGIPVRVIVSMPPQAPATAHVIDVLPLLVLSNGMHIRGASQIVDYLIEK